MLVIDLVLSSILTLELIIMIGLSIVIPISMLLNLISQKYPRSNLIQILNNFVFPQYKGNIKTDKVAHCMAAFCGITLFRYASGSVIRSIFTDNVIWCNLQVKVNSLNLCLFYACSQWFLYVKASLSHAISDASARPMYLRVLRIVVLFIWIAYPLVFSIVSAGIWVDGSAGSECIQSIPKSLLLFAFLLDIPLQVLNFLAFYIPLRNHMKSVKELALSENAFLERTMSDQELRRRNNTEGLHQAAKKAMCICLIAITFSQLSLVANSLVQNSTDLLLMLISRSCYLVLSFCIWFNVSSKWSCKQLRCCIQRSNLEEENIKKPQEEAPLKESRIAPSLWSTGDFNISRSGSKTPGMSLTTKSPRLSATIEEDPKKLPLLCEPAV
jgi:hypothetical protein